MKQAPSLKEESEKKPENSNNNEFKFFVYGSIFALLLNSLSLFIIFSFYFYLY